MAAAPAANARVFFMHPSPWAYLKKVAQRLFYTAFPGTAVANTLSLYFE
jgi:hypothetical protein